MRKLLVFQHAASEPLGVLDPMLRCWGFRIRYANFAREPALQLELSRYDGLIVLGGPMNVDQAAAYPHLLTEIAAIREALRLGMPVLGICLARVLRDTQGHVASALRLSERVFQAFIELFDWRPARRLASR